MAEREGGRESTCKKEESKCNLHSIVGPTQFSPQCLF